MQRRNPLINSGWLWLLTSVIISSLSSNAQAQVVPDATLGNGNNSVTSTVGDRTDITGGLQRNSSLFHSFEQFNVNTNKQVYFANPTDIRNIFSRVTGGNLSNIDGTLGVAGSANLFFINPNGIIFGPNARLDIPGSFFASTADALTFTDGQKFAATGDRAVPLVEVNIPLGLQYGTNAPAMLTNQGQLAVGAGQNLTLAGGITTSNGSLTASGGTVQVLGNQVNLQDQAQIDVSSPTGGGTILVGGDYQGKGSLINANQTSIGTGVTINANAITQGNGGKVIVWSDGTTQFDGTITAKGGVQSGHGGFVETSGKQAITVGTNAKVDTIAFQGQFGNWLLDPTSITIVASGGSDKTVAAANANPGASTIDFSVINDAIKTANVTLTADNFITVNSGTSLSILKDRTLSLNALTVNLNAPIAYVDLATSKLSGTATTVNVYAGAAIQNGVDVAAASGATVNVGAGNYTGSVNVNKPLDLVFKGARVNLTGNLQTTGTSIGLSGILTTTGSQTYNNAVTLKDNTILDSTNNTVNFGSTVTGDGKDLTVNASTGAINFSGAIGSSANPLGNIILNSTGITTLGGAVDAASLTINVGGITQLNGGRITTTGNQSYNDAVSLGANTILQGANLTFSQFNGNNHDLQLDLANQVSVSNSNLSNVGNFTSNGNGGTLINGDFTTIGTQIYNNAVQFGTKTKLISNGNIKFDNTVNGNVSNIDVTINAGSGDIIFNGVVGNTTPLKSINLSGTGITRINGAVISTDGTQTYNNAVVLGDNTTLNTTNDTVQFGSTVAGQGKDLTVNAGTGAINFSGAIGSSVNPLGNIILNSTGSTGITTLGGAVDAASLTTDVGGETKINGGNVSTTNNQVYGDKITLKTDTTLTSSNGNITLDGKVNSQTAPPKDLTIEAQSGTVDIKNTIGSTGNSENIKTTKITASNINVSKGAAIISSNGDITLRGTASVTNSGSLIAPGKTIDISGGQITLNGGSSVNVSGSKGGIVQIDGSQVGIAANAQIHADTDPATAGPGGTIKVTVPNPLDAAIIRTETNITAKGSPTGKITLPIGAASAISAAFPTSPDPNTSIFNDITIIDGNGQSIITALQSSINPFVLPFLENDPILYQYYAGTLFQNFQIPQTALEGTTPSVLSDLLTGQDIILAARNNIAIQNLTNQGATPNQLTLTSPGTTGSIQLAAGGVFTMNQGDTIQTSGRSIQITALNPSGIDNSLTIGGINASSLTTVGGDIILTAAKGNITIGNGINPTLISSNSVGNTVIPKSPPPAPPARYFSRIQVEATTGSVDLNNVQVQANSGTDTDIDSDAGYAGRVSINAANTITATNQTTISANGQFGDITIGSILSPSELGLRPNNIVIHDTQFSAENDLVSLPEAPLLTAGAIRLGANNSIQVIGSKLSSSASANATAGAVEIQTTSTSGIISLNNSTLKSEASGSGGAGVINLIDAGKITLNGTTISNTVVNGNGGETTINGGTIAISGGTTIQADTSGQGSAGNIEITATTPNPDSNTAALTINNSQITATANPGRESDKRGNAGQVSLKATKGDIAIKNSSTISSSTFGDAGSGFANGGVVSVTGQNFSLLNGSVIQARSTGTGRPGSISIDVPHTITISGTNPSGQVSEVSTFSGASADLSSSSSNPSDLLPGDIRINRSESPVNNLILSERGRINASTQSTNAKFTGGNIQVYADNLNITSGGQIVASSLDDGNLDTAQAGAGSINVVSNNINITGSQQSFATDPNFRSAISLKKVGNVTADGTLLTTSGGEPIEVLTSKLGITTPLLFDSKNGSGIQLSAPGNTLKQLSFNWAFSTSETKSSTNPYNDASFFTVNGASLTTLANANSGNIATSPITNQSIGAGNVVNIGIVNVGDTAVASNLQLSNLMVNGDPAQILVNTPDIDPTQPFISGIFAKAGGTGNAGKIVVNTPQLTLEQGAAIAASTEKGTARDIVINGGGAGQVTLSNGAQISGSTAGGKGGTISLTGLNTLQATNSLIEASTTGDGESAGAITVNAAQSVTLDGVLPPGTTDSIGGISTQATNGKGSAGAITVNTAQLNIQNRAAISASTDSGKGDNIVLNGLNKLQLENGIISASTQTGAAGDVTITANQGSDPSIQLLNNSTIEATAKKQKGQAGGVTITATSLTVTGSKIATSNEGPQDQIGGTSKDIQLQGLNSLTVNGGSRITASTQTGQAGAVLVNAGSPAAQSVQITGLGTQLAAQAGDLKGNAGNVILNAKQVKVADKATISASNVFSSGISGQTGGVSFKNLETLEVSGGGTIEAKTQDGQAGNVNVAASQSVLLDQGTLSVKAGGKGKAGILTVTTPTLTLQNSGEILATTTSGGSIDTGSIILKDLNTLKVDNSKVSASTSTKTGTAGSVTITANQGSDPSIQLVNKGTVEAIAEKGGSAGNITLTAPTLNITTGASVAVSSQEGEGTAGDIEVSANKITLDNGTITATTDKGGQASPADIILKDLNNLIATNSSQISASTNSGTAGNVKINATQGVNPSVLLTGDGTLLAAQAGEGGTAGNIILNTKQVKVTDQAKISASNVSGQSGGDVSFENLETLEVSGKGTIEAQTKGDGKAGSINAAASQSVILNDGKIEASAPQGGSAGDIKITTPDLQVKNGGAIAVSSLNGKGVAGSITVTANTVALDNGKITAITDQGGQESPSNITLTGLASLTATNKSEISAATNSGTAGAVAINANQGSNAFVNLDGITIEATADKGGEAGGVAITTPKLVVKNAKISASNVSGQTGGDISLQKLETLEVLEGGAIAATTQDGQAGNVNVEASQSVLLNQGTLSVEATGSGKAGTLTVNTPILTLNDESKISAKTTSGGSKESGNINLQKLNSLTANNSSISAATDSGIAGSVKINADQGSHSAIALNNNSTVETTAKSGRAGTVTLTTSSLTVNRSLISSSATTGEAGDVTVNSGKLALQNKARISVSSPDGQAGKLSVITNDLRMDQSTIEAVTGKSNNAANPNQYNIDLDVQPGGLLLMRNGSLISANARNAASGGNIKIKAPFVIGLTFEDSDIVANAVQGKGGKIDIDTNAILGLQFRPKRTERSDITASSEFGVSGSVNLNTLSTDATRGLSTPAIAFIDVSRLTTNACAAGGAKATASSELRINGRGGVALNPTAPLPAQTTESDWVSLNVTPEVPTTVTFSGGNNVTLESGQTYQLQATCVRSWKEQQRPTL